MPRVAAAAGVWLAIVAAAAPACSAPGQPGGPDPKTSAAGGPASPPSSPADSPGHPMTTGAAASGVGTLGKFWVGQRWITFTEPARAGQAGQSTGPRTLLTQIRYPLAGPPSKTSKPARGPLPLIVFGPGFMQCGGPYSRLLRAWATAGYVVATVNFPHSDCKVGSAATESDMVNQPADMSYVITRMLALSAARHGLFAGLISPHEIAVTGQSDGGDTVAAVAANTCCTDHRVAAIAVLSGAEWPAMPGSFFTRRPAPMLFTQGSADTVNLPGCSAAMYHADPSRMRYYLDLYGADHTGPYWGTNQFERIVARVSLAFFDRFVLGQAAAGPAMKRAGDVPNVAALFGHGHGDVPAGPCFT